VGIAWRVTNEKGPNQPPRFVTSELRPDKSEFGLPSAHQC
jgi:hypothetical protein